MNQQEPPIAIGANGLPQVLKTIPLEPACSGENRKCTICGAIIRPMPNIFSPGKGWVWPKCQCEIDAYVARKNEEEVRERQARIDRFYGLFSMPARFRDRRLDNFLPDAGNQEAYKVVTRFQATIDQRLAEGAGVWITGKAGNGKTHLAAALYHAAREAGNTAVFVTVADLFAKLKSTYGEGAKISEWDLMGPLQQARLLVLDDLGKEKPSEWARERLFIVVNQRYENRRSTVVTTNLSPEVLSERLGEATIDRLTGMCRYLEITSDSRRWTEAPNW